MRELAGAPDAQLLAALATDPAAFEEFYRRHVPAVTAFAVRRLDTPEDVADLVASVFLVVIESADRYDASRGRPVAWLMGIAANLVAARRRRSAREAKALRRVVGHRLLGPDDYAELEAQIDAASDARKVLRALAELPEGERDLVALVCLDGLSPGEAARALGVSSAAGRMRLARARRKLRAALTVVAMPLALIW